MSTRLSVRHGLAGRLNLLTDEQIEAIHVSTLEVLQNTGVQVLSASARELLKDTGAEIDLEKKIVRFPPYLVEEALNKCPSSVTLYGRNPKLFCQFENDWINFGVSGGPPNILDLEGERRTATFNDVADHCRLADALEHIHVGGCDIVGTIEESSLPPRLAQLESAFIRVKNTEKPCVFEPYGGPPDDIIEFCAIIRGGLDNLRKYPMGWAWSNPLSPLIHEEGMTDQVIAYAQRGLPVMFASAIMAGMSGPVTLAGALVQQNAEILSGIVIAQMAADPKHRPPVLYGCASDAIDLKMAQPALGGPEAALLNIAAAQLAKYYQLPCRGTGGCTDSKIPDGQAGYESAMGSFAAALAGINYIYNAAGGLEPGVLAVSFEKLVMDNDSLGYLIRILSGISIEKDTLSVDLINQVGPGGNYLKTKHTRQFFQQEIYFPTIFNRQGFGAWKESGGKNVRKLAQEKARELLASYFPEPLEPELEKELQGFIQKIRDENV